MILKIKKNIFFIIFFLVILIIHQLVFQNFFPNDYGFLGHDYEYFIPQLLSGSVWFKNNFLSVPWFTPSFCCGSPFFADPQSMYYSITQLIFVIFNPITSIKIVFFIFSLISYLGMFLLASKVFRFNSYTSLLCASLFLFNGFFIYRAIAGHMAYLSYIFIPIYCFFLIKSHEKNSKEIKNIYLVISSIIFANFFHSGASPIIIILLAGIISVLLFYSHLTNGVKVFFTFIASFVLGILISLSKISASLFFLKNFPRQYPSTEFNSLVSFIKTIFLSFFIKPDQQYFNKSVKSMFPFGVHEMEYSVGIVPLILIVLSIFLIKNIYKLNYYNLRFTVLILAIFFIPILFNVNFINQFNLISEIPILRSTWIQFRWMLIYIIPLIIISGLILERLSFKPNLKKYLVIFLISTVLIQNYIKDKSWHLEDQKYNPQNALDFFKKIKKGKSHEIIGPAVLLDKDGKVKKNTQKNDLFFSSYSPLLCYQPVFGYGLENLNKSQINFNYKKNLPEDLLIIFSNKLDQKNDNLMFFNPSCFLFPNENNCLPGSTFKKSEKEKLLKFTKYKKFNFNQNIIQIIANYLSFFSFLFCLIYLIYHLVMFILKPKKKY